MVGQLVSQATPHSSAQSLTKGAPRPAKALLGQILARLGREPEARRAFAASAATYRAVLEEPKVQGDLGSFREKCDLVYNYGVAAAQCGQAADAAAALRQALQAGGTSAAEMQSDPDLAGVRGQPWFQELLQP